MRATASASADRSVASTAAPGQAIAASTARLPLPVHRSSTRARRLDQPGVERAVGQQLGDQRARHDDALVDVEGHALQPGFAGQVGGRLARGDALFDQRFDGGLLVGATARARPRRPARPAAGPAATAPARPPRRRRWSCHAQTKRPPPGGGRCSARSGRSSVTTAGSPACAGRCSSARSMSATFTCLVDLVDAGVDGPNSTTCGQMLAMKRPSEVPPVVDSSGVDAGFARGWRRVSASAQAAGRGEEGLAAQRPGQLVVQRHGGRARACTRCLQRLGRRFGAEAEVEVNYQLAGDHVARAGAGVDVRHLPAGRREVLVALVPVAWPPVRPAPAPTSWIGLRASCG